MPAAAAAATLFAANSNATTSAAAAAAVTATATTTTETASAAADLAAAAATTTAEAAAEAASAGAGSGFFEAMQEGLLAAHGAGGLPWWGTLVAATVAVRVSFLPLYVTQAHTAHQVAQAAPDIRYLKALLDRQLRQLATANASTSPPPSSSFAVERLAKWRAFLAGARAAVRLRTERPAVLAVAAPLAQIPFFVTFVLVTRGLIAGGGHGLDEVSE